jgi:hypothetical protein
MGKAHKKFIAGMPSGDQAAAGQGCLGRAHRPNMQIVDFCYAGLLFEKGSDFVGLDR